MPGYLLGGVREGYLCLVLVPYWGYGAVADKPHSSEIAVTAAGKSMSEGLLENGPSQHRGRLPVAVKDL